MMITKMALPRRTVLRGVGAALALPYLESMVPAFAAPAASMRFHVTYVPNSMSQPYWRPKSENGKLTELGAIMAPLEKLKNQIRGLNQAQRNAQDGISLIQTAEGAMSEAHSLLARMRELAVQSANDTINNTDRANLNTEFTNLLAEIDRLQALLIEAYDCGFAASGEGWNGEYPPSDHPRAEEHQARYTRERAAALLLLGKVVTT